MNGNGTQNRTHGGRAGGVCADVVTFNEGIAYSADLGNLKCTKERSIRIDHQIAKDAVAHVGYNRAAFDLNLAAPAINRHRKSARR